MSVIIHAWLCPQALSGVKIMCRFNSLVDETIVIVSTEVHHVTYNSISIKKDHRSLVFSPCQSLVDYGNIKFK